jgi:hypothetical protein
VTENACHCHRVDPRHSGAGSKLRHQRQQRRDQAGQVEPVRPHKNGVLQISWWLDIAGRILLAHRVAEISRRVELSCGGNEVLVPVPEATQFRQFGRAIVWTEWKSHSDQKRSSLNFMRSDVDYFPLSHNHVHHSHVG